MTDEIENILKIIESEKILPDERAKAYRNLNTLLKDENEKDSIYFLCSFLNRFLKRFVLDITNGPTKVVQATLLVLGYVIHSASIVTYYNESQVKELISLLVRTITNAQEKTQCQLAVWCVSVQALNLQAIPLTPLVNAILCAIHSPFKSAGLESECLSALARLIVQEPAAMKECIALWATPILTRLLRAPADATPAAGGGGTSGAAGGAGSSALREKAEMVWRLALPHLRPVPPSLSAVVYEQITAQPDWFDDITNMLNLQDKEALHAVRVWGYLILALGKYLLKGDLINQLLKIPNKTFLHASTSVRIATFHNWRCLIDNFSEGESLNSTRRFKLLMMPFYNSITNDPDISARQAGFMTWAYLVSKVAAANLLQNAEVFKQVVTSYLTHVVRDSEPDIFNLGFESAGLLLHHPSTEEHETSRALVRHTTLEFATMHLEVSSDLLQQQNGQILEFFLDVVKEGAVKHASHSNTFDLTREVWRGLVRQVASCEDNHSLLSLVTVAGQLCSGYMVKYSSMIYEELLGVDTLRKPLLSQHIKLQIGDQQVIPILYLTHYWIMLGNVTSEMTPVNTSNATSADTSGSVEDLVVGFGRVLEFVHSSSVNVLHTTRSLLELVDTNTKMFTITNRGQLVFLLIWAMVAQKISGVVSDGSTDVFGKTNLSSTIDFVHYVLVLPLKEAYCIPLPPHIKTAWTNLFITYHRTASLKVPQFIDHIDSLVQQLSELIDSQPGQPQSDLLVMASAVLLSAVNLSVQHEDANNKKKRKHTPLPQIPSLPPFLASLINVLHKETNPSTPQLLRAIAKAFANQTNSQDLECALAGLSSSLVLWIKEPNPKSRDSIGDAHKVLSNDEISHYILQIKQAVDEVWQEIISCIKRVYASDKYTSDLLERLAPLLIAALSNKHRQIKNIAIQFWNETFARTKSKLIYPSSLISVLASLKEKTNIELPWFPKEPYLNTDQNNEKNTPSIPLEDQTFPPIDDISATHSSGLRGIALSIKQENKSATQTQYSSKDVPVKKLKAGSQVHQKQEQKQVLSSKSSPPNTEYSNAQSSRTLQASSLKEETTSPTNETPTQLLTTLQSLTNRITSSTPAWTNQQLLWAQKQALLLASHISDELCQRRSFP